VSGETYRLTIPLWRWSGPSAANWYFLTIDGGVGEALSATALMDRLEHGKKHGWGSVRLRIRIGASEWQTSAFPSKEQGWIVPVKAAVRRAEGLTEGDAVTVELQF